MQISIRLYITKASDGTLSLGGSGIVTVVIVDVTKIYSHLKRSIHIDIESLWLDMVDSRKLRLLSTCKYRYFQFKVHIDRRRCLLRLLGTIATWEADTSLQVGRVHFDSVWSIANFPSNLYAFVAKCTRRLHQICISWQAIWYRLLPYFSSTKFLFWYPHAFKMTDRQTQTCHMDWNQNQFNIGTCSLLKTQMLQ